MTIKNSIYLEIFCLLMLSFSMPARSSTVHIHGSVSDTTGTLIPGATVTFISSTDTTSAVSDDDGYYELQVTDDPSGMYESETPSPFELFQNYPNPFNPSTTIRFTLPHSGQVRLDIYAVTGQHVRTLVKGLCSSGIHQVSWNGCDDAGRGVSAGVYLYCLRSGDVKLVKKMLLLDGGGAGIHSLANSKIASALKHVSTAGSREYFITAKKSSMHMYFGTVSVMFDNSELEQNIILPDRYRPFELFFDSPRIPNEFIITGDTLSVALVEIHEILPADGTVTVTSQAGDWETVTVSGSGYYHRKYGNCGYFASLDCRKGSLVSASSVSIQHDGVIQVNALSDTVSAWYVSSRGDSVKTFMPFIDSYNSVMVWGYMYGSWKNNEWFIVVDTNNWYFTKKDKFELRFKESTPENLISEFIESNNLQITYHTSEFVYGFTLNASFHAIEFLIAQQSNQNIEYAKLNTYGCVSW